MLIPMHVEIIFVNFPSMLTHQQHIIKKSNYVNPFVNVARYNSKNFFDNMMQSFRRYLKDKKEQDNPKVTNSLK